MVFKRLTSLFIIETMIDFRISIKVLFTIAKFGFVNHPNGELT